MAPPTARRSAIQRMAISNFIKRVERLYIGTGFLDTTTFTFLYFLCGSVILKSFVLSSLMSNMPGCYLGTVDEYGKVEFDIKKRVVLDIVSTTPSETTLLIDLKVISVSFVDSLGSATNLKVTGKLQRTNKRITYSVAVGVKNLKLVCIPAISIGNSNYDGGNNRCYSLAEGYLLAYKENMFIIKSLTKAQQDQFIKLYAFGRMYSTSHKINNSMEALLFENYEFSSEASSEDKYKLMSDVATKLRSFHKVSIIFGGCEMSMMLRTNGGMLWDTTSLSLRRVTAKTLHAALLMLIDTNNLLFNNKHFLDAIGERELKDVHFGTLYGTLDELLPGVIAADHTLLSASSHITNDDSCLPILKTAVDACWGVHTEFTAVEYSKTIMRIDWDKIYSSIGNPTTLASYMGLAINDYIKSNPDAKQEVVDELRPLMFYGYHLMTMSEAYSPSLLFKIVKGKIEIYLKLENGMTQLSDILLTPTHLYNEEGKTFYRSGYNSVLMFKQHETELEVYYMDGVEKHDFVTFEIDDDDLTPKIVEGEAIAFECKMYEIPTTRWGGQSYNSPAYSTIVTPILPIVIQPPPPPASMQSLPQGYPLPPSLMHVQPPVPGYIPPPNHIIYNPTSLPLIQPQNISPMNQVQPNYNVPNQPLAHPSVVNIPKKYTPLIINGFQVMSPEYPQWQVCYTLESGNGRAFLYNGRQEITLDLSSRHPLYVLSNGAVKPAIDDKHNVFYFYISGSDVIVEKQPPGGARTLNMILTLTTFPPSLTRRF